MVPVEVIAGGYGARTRPHIPIDMAVPEIAPAGRRAREIARRFQGQWVPRQPPTMFRQRDRACRGKTKPASRAVNANFTAVVHDRVAPECRAPTMLYGGDGVCYG